MHISVSISWCCLFEVTFDLLRCPVQFWFKQDCNTSWLFLHHLSFKSILTILIHHNTVGVWSCCLKCNWSYSNLPSKSDKLQINIIAKNDRQSIKNWKWWHVRTLRSTDTLPDFDKDLVVSLSQPKPQHLGPSMWSLQITCCQIWNLPVVTILENKPCLSNMFQWQSSIFLVNVLWISGWSLLVWSSAKTAA